MNRLGNRSLMDRSPFKFVRRKQIGATPTGETRSHFPSQINRVANSHIHAETAEWRMQMAGVPAEKHAALRVFVGYKLVGHPQVGTNNLDVEIPQACAASNKFNGIDRCEINIIDELRYHEGPKPSLVHRTQK